jgi:hypothetical protein
MSNQAVSPVFREGVSAARTAVGGRMKGQIVIPERNLFFENKDKLTKDVRWTTEKSDMTYPPKKQIRIKTRIDALAADQPDNR